MGMFRFFRHTVFENRFVAAARQHRTKAYCGDMLDGCIPGVPVPFALPDASFPPTSQTSYLPVALPRNSHQPPTSAYPPALRASSRAGSLQCGEGTSVARTLYKDLSMFRRT